MALTAPSVPSASFVPGSRRHVITPVSADNSYPTGGYVPAPSLFNLTQIDWWLPIAFGAIPVGCAEFVKNSSTGKLQFLIAAGTEVTAATSLTGTSVYILAAGV